VRIDGLPVSSIDELIQRLRNGEAIINDVDFYRYEIIACDHQRIIHELNTMDYIEAELRKELMNRDGV
jgi:hypothetical protein